MKNLKKLTKKEMKEVTGGEFPFITYVCKDGTTQQSGGICDPASSICYEHGGVAFCNS
jgi:bacteriocin-like protein